MPAPIDIAGHFLAQITLSTSRRHFVLYCNDMLGIQKGLADFTKHLLACNLLHAPVPALVAGT